MVYLMTLALTGYSISEYLLYVGIVYALIMLVVFEGLFLFKSDVIQRNEAGLLLVLALMSVVLMILSTVRIGTVFFLCGVLLSVFVYELLKVIGYVR